MPWEGTRAQDEQLWQALNEALNDQGWPAQRLEQRVRWTPLRYAPRNT